MLHGSVVMHSCVMLHHCVVSADETCKTTPAEEVFGDLAIYPRIRRLFRPASTSYLIAKWQHRECPIWHHDDFRAKPIRLGNPANTVLYGVSPGGGIGRHRGFKIPRPVTAMRVQVPPRASGGWSFGGCFRFLECSKAVSASNLEMMGWGR